MSEQPLDRTAASRRFVCPAAPPHWSAEWLPPAMGAIPKFCPWCGERIEEHNNYLLTVTTGISEARDAA